MCFLTIVCKTALTEERKKHITFVNKNQGTIRYLAKANALKKKNIYTVIRNCYKDLFASNTDML